MELQLLLAFALFMVMVFRIMMKQMKRNHSAAALNLPPGPWRLPLIGNLHQLVGSLPHRRMRDLAEKNGPLMHLQLGEVSNIVVSSPEAAMEVMKNHDINFSQRPTFMAANIMTYNCTDVAFAPYGDYWRHLRKICTLELLSAKRVQSFRSIREEEASNLIAAISANSHGLESSVNISRMLFSLMNTITIRAAFGGSGCQDHEELMEVIHKVMEIGAGLSLADLFPSIKILETLSGLKSEVERLHQELDKIYEKIINDHKRSSKAVQGEADDLVHVLLNFNEQGDLDFNLTTDNIKAVITDLFLAGTDTSFTVTEWAMSEMMRNPRVMEKAQAEVRQVFDQKGNVDEPGLGQLQYLKLVIKETLRLHSPIPLLLPRECRESCKIFGYDIPKGSRVIVNAWAIGRDPGYWNDPENFYPERFLSTSIDYKGTDFEFIPFGAGRRMCPGVAFGMANVELPLAKLLYHFNWKLPKGAPGNKLDMSEHFAAAVRRKNDLLLVPISYCPLLVPSL